MSCCSMKSASETISNKTLVQRIAPYKPLILMVLVVLLASWALAARFELLLMPLFMGLFLINFSMFKLFDINGFAKSFAMYDIIAKRSTSYAKAYPFIELVLGLFYLTLVAPFMTNVVTAVVMGIGLIGVVQNLRGTSATRCACMGTLIDVPVGSVTVLENTTMILMALMNIWMLLG
jgi:hypothetical protein